MMEVAVTTGAISRTKLQSDHQSTPFCWCVIWAGVVHWLIYVVVHMFDILARSKRCK